jgi:hypothetical protein
MAEKKTGSYSAATTNMICKRAGLIPPARHSDAPRFV